MDHISREGYLISHAFRIERSYGEAQRYNAKFACAQPRGVGAWPRSPEPSNLGQYLWRLLLRRVQFSEVRVVTLTFLGLARIMPKRKQDDKVLPSPFGRSQAASTHSFNPTENVVL